MKGLAIALGVAYLVAPILMFVGGYRAGLRRNQALSLRALGLSTTTINRYRDAMRLLHGMVRGSDLDGPFVGNILTEPTEREASRLVDEYRHEIGI